MGMESQPQSLSACALDLALGLAFYVALVLVSHMVLGLVSHVVLGLASRVVLGPILLSYQLLEHY